MIWFHVIKYSNYLYSVIYSKFFCKTKFLRTQIFLQLKQLVNTGYWNMDDSEDFTFPYLFDNYLFTPTFIKNLQKRATSDTKVTLTPQEIYFIERELETKVYVKKLEELVEAYRRRIFDNCLEEFLSNNCIYHLLENYSFSDILQLEWFRFMHLEILGKEVSKLEHLLQQLNLDFTEAHLLNSEVHILRVEVNHSNQEIKDIVRNYQLLYMNTSLQYRENLHRTRLV